MFAYKAYGLTLRSALRLPELDEADPGATPDVMVTRAPVDVSRTNGSPATCLWADADEVCLRYEGTTYLIRGGREITIDAATGADEVIQRLYLLGASLSVLLHQRKYLVLHASAVVTAGGGAVGFLGDKGAGKSTTAAALHARGNLLIADDIIAVSFEGQIPMAHPGIPHMKLWPEAAARVGAAPESLPLIHPDFEKRGRRTAEGFATEPAALKRMYVLTDGEEEGVEPLPPQQAVMELVRFTFVLALLQSTGTSAAHFHQAAALARAVPVCRLVRRRSLDALDELARFVETDAASGTP